MKAIYFILFLVFVVLTSCVAPPSIANKEPLRDNFPVNELLIINNLADSLSLLNLDRLDNAENPFIVNNLLLTGNVPNSLKIQNSLAYIVNSYGNSINIIDLSSVTKIKSIKLQTGDNPWDIGLVEIAGKVYGFVSTFLANELVIIDFGFTGKDENIIARLPLQPTNNYQAHPEGVTVINDKVYISCSGWNFENNSFNPGFVAVLSISNSNPTNWNIIAYIETATNPQAIIPFPNDNRGHIICSGINNQDDGIVQIFNTTSDTILENITIGGSPGCYTINTNNGNIWLGGTEQILQYNSNGTIINGSFDPFYQGENSQSFFSGICYDYAYSNLFATDFGRDLIIQLNPANGTLLNEIAVGDGPHTIIYNRVE